MDALKGLLKYIRKKTHSNMLQINGNAEQYFTI